jgi:hypothetical protein
MSFDNPAYHIPRWSVVGHEGMWVKMFDPIKASPPTPERMAPTNPVPEVMFAAGLQDEPRATHVVQRDLMHGDAIPTWDGLKDMNFMLIRDGDNDAATGTFPGPTIRMPRGVVFHAETQGHGPPPHTIHWHGHEPTPINDGVGHCSMEIGDYTYQWQPSFIGTYFYHCHRNTVQHFEFGLYGATIIDPPDAYFATQQNPAVRIGACRDGKFRTGANLQAYPQFPGWKGGAITDPDPLGQYPVDPHAMTVPYDVEVLWVPDDRDSVWSDLAKDPRATYPVHGDRPGFNDNFNSHAGEVAPDVLEGFFAFNDFNPDYWYITGVPVPAHRGETGAIPPNLIIPPQLMSGVSGVQVSVNAKVGDTILFRVLDAAYHCIEVTFPVDVVIIEWDGRALGVPPFTKYSHAYTVPAGTPIHQSVARRFNALMRVDAPLDDVAVIKFIDTRGQVPGEPEVVVCTAEIPITITGAPPLRVTEPLLGGSYAGGAVVPLEWTSNPAVGGGMFHAYAYAANGTYHWLNSQAAQAGKNVYQYDWTVTQPQAIGYRIRVWYVDPAGNWQYFADSANTFAITTSGLPAPTVTQPSTGGPFAQGQVVPVEWTVATPSGVGAYHAYALTGEGTYLWLNSQNAVAGKSVYNFDWNVVQAPGQGYKVRVWYVDGSGNWLLFSDSSTFAIEAGSLPVPNVTTPSTAGPFDQGATVPVAWTVPAAVGSGTFHAYAYSGSGTYNWLQSVPANGSTTSYSFDWLVTQAPGTGYVVRVWYTDSSGNWLFFGDSSPAFEITGAALPAPTVTQPNTGGSFHQLEVVPLAWSLSPQASAGMVHAYALDTSGNYYWINSQNAAGQTSFTFDWTIPLSQPSGGGYVLRVWYVDGAGNWLSYDDSDAPFAITIF